MPDEEVVQRSLLPENPSNGGFPEPPASMSVRIVAARHDACGNSTRVRLPSSVPARAVHRLRCDHCEKAFEIGEVDDFGLESELNDLEKAVPARKKKAAFRRPSVNLPKKLALPKLEKPKFSKPKFSKPKIDPESRTWRLATIPVAAVLVIGGLVLVQGGGDDPAPEPQAAVPDTSPPSVPARRRHQLDPAGDRRRSDRLADDAHGPRASDLRQPAPRAAAAMPNSSPAPPTRSRCRRAGSAPNRRAERPLPPPRSNGEADATLWITRDPKLDFPTFVCAVAGSARSTCRLSQYRASACRRRRRRQRS